MEKQNNKKQTLKQAQVKSSELNKQTLSYIEHAHATSARNGRVMSPGLITVVSAVGAALVMLLLGLSAALIIGVLF